jgi:hypothetical protein
MIMTATDDVSPKIVRAFGIEDRNSIKAFHDGAFGPPTGPVAPMLRAVNEIAEALVALGVPEDVAVERLRKEYARQIGRGTKENIDDLPSELAGVVIVLMRVAQAAGFDLFAAVDEEMRRNRRRTSFSDGNGDAHVVVPSETPERKKDPTTARVRIRSKTPRHK